MEGRTQSTISNESAILQKLGFEEVGGQALVFAECINGVRKPIPALQAFLQVCLFLQAIGMAFLANFHGMFDDQQELDAVKFLLNLLIDWGSITGDEHFANMVLMCVFTVLVFSWIVIYAMFTSQYKKNNTFDNRVVMLLYIIGYPFARIVSVVVASCIGFCFRPLIFSDTGINSMLSILGLLTLMMVLWVSKYVLEAVHSSPDIDAKDKVALWPRCTTPFLFRDTVYPVMSLMMGVIRHVDIPAELPHGIVMVGGIVGLIITYQDDYFVFPTGRIYLAIEYVMMITGGVLSTVSCYLKVSGAVYMALFVVIVVVAGILIKKRELAMLRSRMMWLEMPFEDLTEEIDTPKQCITFIKTGLVFACECVRNKSLLMWATSRWPNERDLLLFVAYIQYIMEAPYRELLDLVSIAMDISPLVGNDTLMFGQIFQRLPTKEHLLLKKLEGVRRLYDLPTSDARNFWRAVGAQQWDEALAKSASLQKDLEHIRILFDSMMFKNPASDAVLQEFVRFCTDVKGDSATGASAKVALKRRRALELEMQEQENAAKTAEPGSMQQNSKLSSVRSSIFMEESRISEFVDKSQHSIEMAVEARPVFWPGRFLLVTICLSVLSLTSVIVVFAIGYSEINRMNDQSALVVDLFNTQHVLVQIAEYALDFAAWNEEATAAEKEKEEDYKRSNLNALVMQLDDLMSRVMTAYLAMPFDALKLWVSTEFETEIPSPEELGPASLTFAAGIRLYHAKAQALACSPLDYIGGISTASPEVLSIPSLFPTISDGLAVVMDDAVGTIQAEIEESRRTVIFISGSCVGGLVLLGVIACIIVVIGIKYEIDFFLQIYGSIPPKIIARITKGERKVSSKTTQDTSNSSGSAAIQHKNELALKYYRLNGVMWIFFAVALVTVIPLIVFVVADSLHRDVINNVSRGMRVSLDLMNALGYMWVRACQLIVGFESDIADDLKVRQFVGSSSAMIGAYTELYFGGTDVFPEGLAGSDTSTGAARCQIVTPNEGLAAGCMDFHQNIFLIEDMAKRLSRYDLANLPSFKGRESEWWKMFFETANVTLNEGIPEFQDIFEVMLINERDFSSMMMIVGLVVGIALFCCDLFISVQYMRGTLLPAMSALLKPISLMSPEHIAEVPMLVRFLQGDFDDASRKTITESKQSKDTTIPLMDFILEGVLVTTSDGTIIASNSKYHELMASSAEEVLGVNVKTVLPPTLMPLYEALDRFKAGTLTQQNVSIETNIFTEDARDLSVRISLVANFECTDRSGKGAACAFIISDKSDVIKNQTLLRKEKQKVEELLDSILPHHVAVSLLNGQTEISFEVEKAAVLFSDIVSFTPMCSTMTAKQVMNMLNHLFAQFDTELSNWRRITKLKTIGDAYVCAAGIFEGDAPLEEAACELVSFSMRMQEIIPEVNKTLGTGIHMRIGIHVDGPLICGVLGKDKPLFEVIGNVVTLAEDLEASGAHDKLHVAQGTLDLIGKLNLPCQERGGNIKVHGIEPPTFTIG